MGQGLTLEARIFSLDVLIAGSQHASTWGISVIILLFIKIIAVRLI